MASYGDIRQLSPSQKKIVKQIIRQGRQAGKKYGWSPRERRKAINTGLAIGYTESRYSNPSGGDRDSAGVRQERQMYYKDPTNLKASIGRLYDEYQADAPKGGSLGQRAQAVQQSGTPYVWDNLKPLANQIRKDFGKKVGDASQGRGPIASQRRPGQTVTRTPGVDNSETRKQLKLDYLANRHNPDALLSLAGGLKEAKDVPGTVKTNPAAGKRFVGGVVNKLNPKLANTAGKTPSDIIAAGTKAERLNNRGKLPYKWGGGHGLSPAQMGELVDCSGFVSQLLGVSPRVSGQFATGWGKPGRGRFVTVYANPGHVLMSVRDPKSGKLRWFATSSSNRGGGAGEISQPSASYLAGFTARHPGRGK